MNVCPVYSYKWKDQPWGEMLKRKVWLQIVGDKRKLQKSFFNDLGRCISTYDLQNIGVPFGLYMDHNEFGSLTGKKSDATIWFTHSSQIEMSSHCYDFLLLAYFTEKH